MRDIRQISEYADYLSQIGWDVERVRNVNYFIKKLPLIGSLIKIQRPEKLDLNKVRNLAKKHRAFQIIVEPKTMANGQWLMDKGFKLSSSPFLPPRTLCLDLTKSKEKLFAGLKKDCRQAVKKNKDLKTFDKSPEAFRKIWKTAIGFRRYIPSLDHLIALKKSFGTNCLFITSGGSGAIFLVGDKIAYYWQAFTDKRGRKEQVQYKIVWEGILWTKKKGAKIFDFEGIYDERFPNKSWYGFTHFKKSFGGYEVEYPGAFVKNLWPFRK